MTIINWVSEGAIVSEGAVTLIVMERGVTAVILSVFKPAWARLDQIKERLIRIITMNTCLMGTQVFFLQVFTKEKTRRKSLFQFK
jgi:hypothetical protein